MMEFIKDSHLPALPENLKLLYKKLSQLLQTSKSTSTTNKLEVLPSSLFEAYITNYNRATKTDQHYSLIAKYQQLVIEFNIATAKVARFVFSSNDRYFLYLENSNPLKT